MSEQNICVRPYNNVIKKKIDKKNLRKYITLYFKLVSCATVISCK